MSLTRLYPLPSDRMAIMWTLMPISEAMVLEYGPAGTTHFGGGLFSGMGISLNHTLFTTHISEDDVVMGDVSRLENAIRELDAAYAPKVIFVVASAVVAVIGSDIKGVCNYMQEEVNARLICFDDGGFRGDYTYGLRAAYKLLAKELVEECNEKEDSYLILGASAGNYRMRSDVWELKNLMKEAFDMDCHMVMGLESSVDEMACATKAKISLVLREEALEAAKIIEEKGDVPYVYGAPYGYKGTLEWLEKISAKLGKEINPSLKQRLKEKIMYMMPMGGPMAKLYRNEPQVCLEADYDTLLGFRNIMNELSLDVVAMICSHTLKAISEPDANVVYYKSEKERIEAIKKMHGAWILGSNEVPMIMSEDNYFTCIASPSVGKSQVANHLPFMGEKGMDYLLELKDEYFASCNI